MIDYESVHRWNSPYCDGEDIPSYLLSENSRQLVKALGSSEKLCQELCMYFSRFADIMPTKRLFTHEHRAILGLRLANLRHYCLNEMFKRAEQHLFALEHCQVLNPCRLIGCPTCSIKRRAQAMNAAARFICGAVAYNHEIKHSETVVLAVTLANRALWCRKLKDVNSVVTGRHNSLRKAIKMLFGKELAGFGQITDVLASLDIKYDSPIDPNLHNSEDNVSARLEADCDVHIHALICFTPYNKQYLQDVDWAKAVRRGLRESFPAPFDVHVQHLDHELTRTRLCKAGIQTGDLTPLANSVIYQLAYQTKTTTLDSVSSRERPLIQAAIAKPLKDLKGIMMGDPIVMLSQKQEDIARFVYLKEYEIASKIKNFEEQAVTD
jgi:hypothetical protein